MKVDREFFLKWSPSFPIDKNVQEFTACNLSNAYDIAKPVGSFSVGQTEGDNVLGVSWNYGYEATTYGELATKVGVNVMTLHYHLSDKMTREYLLRYFFLDFLGRGLVKTTATESLQIILARPHRKPRRHGRSRDCAS